MAPQGYRLQPMATIIEPDKVGKNKNTNNGSGQ